MTDLCRKGFTQDSYRTRHRIFHALQVSPATDTWASGRLTRSTLHNALKGRQLPSEQMRVTFAAACGAGQPTTDALLDARRRIKAGPRPLPMYPCEYVERADERRQQDEAARPWITVEPEPDWYDQQLRDEEEAEHRRMTAWVDALSDDELAQMQAQAAAGAGRDLRAEPAALAARSGTSGTSGR
ncbi:hypothetical protein [Streptomyces sp. NPDC088794]|uniref:hypothetical protein n=1 Tax=Streptomyces sp. NPDC088794 TaxID=3365902 RepID=UPI003808FAD5